MLEQWFLVAYLVRLPMATLIAQQPLSLGHSTSSTTDMCMQPAHRLVKF